VDGSQVEIWDEIVVGGGIAGLTTAWELARAGQSVLLLESSDRFGGPVGLMDLTPRPGHAGRALPSGLRVEWGAESFATKNPAVPRLLIDLGLSDRTAAVSPAGSWIVDAPDRSRSSLRALPSPNISLFGIPGDLASPDVVAFLGADDAAEAARLDALPMAEDASASAGMSIGELVRSRMGAAVLERLVAPVVTGVYSAGPDEIEASRLHPRLLGVLSQEGSLAGAVRALRAGMSAGAAVAGVDGGMGLVAETLADRAAEAGADLRLRHEATGLVRVEQNRAGQGDSPLNGSLAVVVAPGHRQFLARSVTLAVPAGPGRALLESLAPGSTGDEDEPLGFEQGERIVLVTLVFAAGTESARRLADHPRGSGLLVAPSARGPELSVAKAITHASSKWAWLRERLEGAEVIRLSFNEPDLLEACLGGHAIGDSGGSGREELLERAVKDAALLMGCPLSLRDVAGTAVAVHRNTAPLRRTGMNSARASSSSQSLDTVLEDPRLENVRAAGSWHAGTGLVAVVSQARSRQF
jgi:oxygen-dependent protoporphyrinogen oxidase